MEVSVDAVSRSGAVAVAAGVNQADNFESLLSFPFLSAALFLFCAPLAYIRFISVKTRCKIIIYKNYAVLMQH